MLTDIRAAKEIVTCFALGGTRRDHRKLTRGSWKPISSLLVERRGGLSYGLDELVS